MTHKKLAWASAVKIWNKQNAWADDMYALPKKAGQYYQDIVDIIAEYGGPKPMPAPAPVLPPEVERQDLFSTGYRPQSEEQKEESEKANAQTYINRIQSFTTYFRPEDWAKSSSNDKIDDYQTIKILNDMKSGKAKVSKYLKPYLDFKLPEKVQKGYDKWIEQGKPSKKIDLDKPRRKRTGGHGD